MRRFAPCHDKGWGGGFSSFIILNWVRSICLYRGREKLKLCSDKVFSWEGRQEVLFSVIYGFFPFKMAYFFIKDFFPPRGLISNNNHNKQHLCISLQSTLFS